jgi:hypothetical protein
MAHGDGAGEFRERCGVGVVIADEAHAPLGMESPSIEGDDAGCFLAAVLERMKAECRQRRCVGMAKDAENAAFLMKFITEQVIDLGTEIVRGLAHGVLHV